MIKYRYFVRNPYNDSIRACITLIKHEPRVYDRIIVLANNKMKLKKGDSIKELLSEFSDKIVNDYIINSQPIPEELNRFEGHIWEDFMEIWIWNYGIKNYPDPIRIQKNVKLCNHEYRMVVSPGDRN